MSNFVLKHRVLIIVVFFTVTAIFALFLPGLKFNGDIRAMAPPNLPAVVAFNEAEEAFGGADSLAVAVSSPDLFTPGKLSEAAGIQEELAALSDVADVISVFTYTIPEFRDDALEFPPVVDPQALPEDDAQIAILKQKLQAESAVSGKLVSGDFDTILYLIQTSASTSRPELVESVRAILDSHRGFTTYLAGTPILNHGMVTYMQKDILVFVVFGFLSVVIVLLVGFRSFRGVLLPILTIASSLIVTFGFMGLLGAKITIVALIIPVMLIAICNNYAIHFLTRYYEDTLVNGISDRAELMRSSFRSLRKPVWLAFITTVASFLSFVSSPIPRVVEMGLFIVFGICFAFLMTMFFIPALLATLPPPKTRRHSHPDGNLFSRIAGPIGSGIFRWRVPVVVGSLILVAGAALFIPGIKVDSELANYFNKKDPIRKAIDFINAEVGGSQVIKVIIPGDPREAETLARADLFRETAEKTEGVGSVFSLVDSIRSLNRVLHDGDPVYDASPTDDAAAAELFFLIETSLAPERLVQLVSEDYSSIAMNVQLRTTESKDVDRIVRGLRREAETIFGPGSGAVSIAGIPIIASELNRLVIVSMIQSLVLALVMIFASVAIGFRNFAAGATSSVIMGIIITFVFGIMGLLGIELSTATALVASITLGVGIDYSIHFAARWFRERHETGSKEKAASRTLVTTGQGIIINALAIAFSVMPAFFSQFRPVVYFGVLCFVSILFSLLGGMGLMPAVLSVLPERSYRKIS